MVARRGPWKGRVFATTFEEGWRGIGKRKSPRKAHAEVVSGAPATLDSGYVELQMVPNRTKIYDGVRMFAPWSTESD